MRTTLRVIRRGGLLREQGRDVTAASNQALLTGAPTSPAAARVSVPSLRSSLLAFIRIALTVPQPTARSYVLAALQVLGDTATYW